MQPLQTNELLLLLSCNLHQSEASRSGVFPQADSGDTRRTERGGGGGR